MFARPPSKRIRRRRRGLAGTDDSGTDPMIFEDIFDYDLPDWAHAGPVTLTGGD